jgi:hypothetical protein
MKRVKAVIMQSISKIFESLSDEQSVELYTTIATKDINSLELRNKVSTYLTRKQYYSRLSRMVSVGLIKRRNGKLVLTSFGKIVYESKTILEAAYASQWKLKVLDSIGVSDELPTEERKKLLDNLIENERLKEILSKN